MKSCWTQRRPGLDPATGHRIVEIGAVELMNQAPTGRTYHVLINPERDVPDEAVRVHGHTAAILQDKPIFSAVADEFLAFVGDAQIVIHNAEFDVRFLNAELTRIERELIDFSRVTDTLALARKRHPGQPNSLDALCDRYRIDRSRRIRHGALLDAEILVEVYCELTGGRQKSLSFDAAALSKVGAFVGVTTISTANRRARAPLIRVDETIAHAEHVKTLGEGAIWLRLRPRSARNPLRLRGLRLLLCAGRSKPLQIEGLEIDRVDVERRIGTAAHRVRRRSGARTGRGYAAPRS